MQAITTLFLGADPLFTCAVGVLVGVMLAALVVVGSDLIAIHLEQRR